MTSTDLSVINDDTPIDPEALLTAEGAKQITDTIKERAQNVWELVVIAYQGRAWAALGYDSWDAYLEKEFDGAPLRLPRETRKDAVLSLRGAGLSLRAIAAAADVSPQTVANDLADSESGVQKVDTSQLTEEQHVRMDELTAKEGSDDEFLTDEEHAELTELRDIIAVDAELVEDAETPSETTGIDGKQYKKKSDKPKTPRADKVPPLVAKAKKLNSKLAAPMSAIQEFMDSDEVKGADKETQEAITKAFAYTASDVSELFGLKLTARWSKLL